MKKYWIHCRRDNCYRNRVTPHWHTCARHTTLERLKGTYGNHLDEAWFIKHGYYLRPTLTIMGVEL